MQHSNSPVAALQVSLDQRCTPCCPVPQSCSHAAWQQSWEPHMTTARCTCLDWSRPCAKSLTRSSTARALNACLQAQPTPGATFRQMQSPCCVSTSMNIHGQDLDACPQAQPPLCDEHSQQLCSEACPRTGPFRVLSGNRHAV